jgi:hypothetical protein
MMPQAARIGVLSRIDMAGTILNLGPSMSLPEPGRQSLKSCPSPETKD